MPSHDELDASTAALGPDISDQRPVQGSSAKPPRSDAHTHASGLMRKRAIKTKLRKAKEHHVDGGENVDSVLINACVEIHRMHVFCEESVAQSAATEADKPMSAESSAPDSRLRRTCLEYEDRMLHLQDQPAHGGTGLLVMGERLEEFLEFKTERLDDELLALFKAYLANVRRVVGANNMTRTI